MTVPRDSCQSDSCAGYAVLGGSSENAQRQYAGDEEDLLLQYAIRQSLDSDTATEQVRTVRYLTFSRVRE